MSTVRNVHASVRSTPERRPRRIRLGPARALEGSKLVPPLVALWEPQAGPPKSPIATAIEYGVPTIGPTPPRFKRVRTSSRTFLLCVNGSDRSKRNAPIAQVSAPPIHLHPRQDVER